MNEVAAPLARGREFTPADFADLTTAPVVLSWGDDGNLVVEADEPLAEDVVAAIRRRIMSRTDREEALRAEAEAALETIDAADLTALRAQVARLTEIVLGYE